MSGASRILLAGTTRALGAPRAFSTSARRMADAAPLPPKKPVGAFRAGLLGFLGGCVLSGGAVYNYLVQEFKAANDMLSEDIYVCHAPSPAPLTCIRAVDVSR
ncbi:uncharacterized protein MAM_08005 [Metarhizium album ARSEF 1941]|uniref:Uncharacterized protein n=1 Tax=Metarhizium album (strain ARSEF 1941) TaxID=1081103 RepID=A0A0B2WMC3_METAS|nr:uncharacterized protein MAM_08005 [Metarhizium album ARSEF 1941]KHN94165.1 hypothetical protein MAM_08005 [Metarhizium album ARSEF 1941]